MSSAGPGRREVARRLFAVEFDESTYSYRSGEEERAPIYVVSPTGVQINRLFAVGVLTESTWVNDETLRARIADPTGSFVVYAGQYQPDARARLDDLSEPAFVAVTGKANVFEPDDGDRVWTSIRPEAIAEVDAETRDRWVVNTADRTFERIGRMAGALSNDQPSDDGIRHAIEAYEPTAAYLAALYERSVEALEVVTGEREAVDTGRLDPGLAGDPSIPLDDLIALAGEDFEPGTTSEPPTAPEPGASDAADGGPTPSSEPADAERPHEAKDEGTSEEAEEPADALDEPTQVEEPIAPEASDTDEVPEGDLEESSGVDVDLDDASVDDAVLDNEEREALEAEFGTDFATGEDIPEPDTTAREEPSEAASAPPENGTEETEETLVDVVMATMAELDDGTGVPRDELVEAVTDRADAAADEIEDAITEALMDGRCYEPSEDVVQPI